MLYVVATVKTEIAKQLQGDLLNFKSINEALDKGENFLVYIDAEFEIFKEKQDKSKALSNEIFKAKDMLKTLKVSQENIATLSLAMKVIDKAARLPTGPLADDDIPYFYHPHIDDRVDGIGGLLSCVHSLSSGIFPINTIEKADKKLEEIKQKTEVLNKAILVANEKLPPEFRVTFEPEAPPALTQKALPVVMQPPPATVGIQALPATVISENDGNMASLKEHIKKLNDQLIAHKVSVEAITENRPRETISLMLDRADKLLSEISANIAKKSVLHTDAHPFIEKTQQLDKWISEESRLWKTKKSVLNDRGVSTALVAFQTKLQVRKVRLGPIVDDIAGALLSAIWLPTGPNGLLGGLYHPAVEQQLKALTESLPNETELDSMLTPEACKAKAKELKQKVEALNEAVEKANEEIVSEFGASFLPADLIPKKAARPAPKK